MSSAYAIGTAINWGNEAWTLTFRSTFGLNHIVMILHKRHWLKSRPRSLAVCNCHLALLKAEDTLKQVAGFLHLLTDIKPNDGG